MSTPGQIKNPLIHNGFLLTKCKTPGRNILWLSWIKRVQRFHITYYNYLILECNSSKHGQLCSHFHG